MSTATTVRVAAVQLAATQDLDENLATCVRMVGEAADLGAQVVVLPEFCNHVSWYAGREHAQRMAQDARRPVRPRRSLASPAAAACWVMVNVTLRAGRRSDHRHQPAPRRPASVVATSDKQVLMGSERDHLDGAIDRRPGRGDPVRPRGHVLLHGRRHQRDAARPRRCAAPRCCSTPSTPSPSTRRRCTSPCAPRRTGSGSWPPTRSDRWSRPSRLGAGQRRPSAYPTDRLHGAGESQIVAPGRHRRRARAADRRGRRHRRHRRRRSPTTRPDPTAPTSSPRAVRRPIRPCWAPSRTAGRHPPGDAQLDVAVVQPGADGAAAIAEAAGRVRDAVARGAQLVVLPELFCFADGVVAADDDARSAVRLPPSRACSDALHGSERSRGRPPSPLGRRSRRRSCRRRGSRAPASRSCTASARHADWVRRARRRRVRASSVLACPGAARGRRRRRRDLSRDLPARDPGRRRGRGAAVPRAGALGAAHRPGRARRREPAESSSPPAVRPSRRRERVIDLPKDFTLWAAWDKPFDGVISHPDVDRVPAAAVTHLRRGEPGAGRQPVRVQGHRPRRRPPLGSCLAPPFPHVGEPAARPAVDGGLGPNSYVFL